MGMFRMDKTRSKVWQSNRGSNVMSYVGTALRHALFLDKSIERIVWRIHVRIHIPLQQATD